MTPLFAYSCLGLSMLLVGGNIAVGKLVLAEVPVFLFAFLRFLIATLVLLPGMALPRVRRGLDQAAGKGLFLQAFFGCFLFSLFMLYGVVHTSAASAGIITSATPSVIALLAWLWLRERIGGRSLLAIALAVGGIAVLNLLDSQGQGAGGLLGNTLVLGAVLAEAIFAIFSRRLSLSLHPWAMAFGVNLAGLLLFLPLALPQGLAFDWSAPSAITWGWVLFYAISASVLSFLLWYRGISQVPANVAGLFTGLMPVGAALVGVLLLGERFTSGQALGMALVLAAIALGGLAERKANLMTQDA
ncbi:DMT family transporter [Pseudomonas sp. JM0905a]|uniref:DMT family transporter n=1 Tax=Metapseudomonas resinovorans TaxID=53412 RepID=A0ABT4YDC6_METRE|nr:MULTISPECIES: DMT family transporter [Pseudomonas]MBD2836518.1 DMT family transporter [Pseudomonas sp. JM0905a]MDA8486763.1 DMT family transporter [Pseudomonas resinovorans]